MPTERPSESRGAATSGTTVKVQENDAERRHARHAAVNIVVLNIKTQARSGSPRFRWRSRSVEIYVREHIYCRPTTGVKYMAHSGSEGALCRPNDLLKVAERLRAERLRKSKKTSQSKRGAFANDVVLTIKPQARSGSPRFRWRSGFAEVRTRRRTHCRQTTGPK